MTVDLQQCISLVIVACTAALMILSRVRKSRGSAPPCGECGNCTSPQKTIRYRSTRGEPFA